MEQNTQKQKNGGLRKLGKPVYIYIFPLLFAGGYLAFRDYWESYYQTEWPVWTLFLIFPLILLGMAVGYQLQFYLQKTLGKKGELFVDIVLSLILVAALFAEYQYVLAPQLGTPPLSWPLIWDVLKKKLPF